MLDRSNTVVEESAVRSNWTDTLLSDRGSSRGSAYIENNKILWARGKLHVTWLDAGRGGPELVQVKTLEERNGQWSPTFTLGEAVDNHGGPTLVRDGDGYLHTVFGPHHGPFSYRHSVRPDDASDWGPVELFGERCTYPSLVCDAQNTLHLVCRESDAPDWRLTYYRRKPGESWTKVGPLVTSTKKDGSYRCYRASLYLDGAGNLHLSFMLFGGEHFKDAREKGLAGYLRSNDGGNTWTHFDGAAVEDLPTDTAFERIPVTDNCIRTGNLVVLKDGRPCIATVSTGFRGYSDKWGEAVLWRREDNGWQAISLNPFIEKAYPHHRASWAEPSMSVSDDGRLYLALTAVDVNSVDHKAKLHCGPKAKFGNHSSRLVLLMSSDGGETFDVQCVGRDVPDMPSWLPSLERFTGHNKIPHPYLLYTYGSPGLAQKMKDISSPKDAVTEIRLITLTQ